jgi:hypothetical protein
MHQCAQSRPVPCIRRAALHWRVPTALLVRKARCESRLDPLARNGVNVGLFQFNYPGTWGSTPYARRSPWSAKWSSLAAGWMHSAGVDRGSEWSCR